MAAPMVKRSSEERKAILSQYLVGSVRNGWRIETQLEFSAVLVTGNKVNHVLHLLIAIFTCGLWVFVWAFLAATGGERRMTVHVDDFGNCV